LQSSGGEPVASRIKTSLQFGHFRKGSRRKRVQMDRPCLLIE
jgi:hypothetical protein